MNQGVNVNQEVNVNRGMGNTADNKLIYAA